MVGEEPEQVAAPGTAARRGGAHDHTQRPTSGSMKCSDEVAGVAAVGQERAQGEPSTSSPAPRRVATAAGVRVEALDLAQHPQVARPLPAGRGRGNTPAARGRRRTRGRSPRRYRHAHLGVAGCATPSSREEPQQLRVGALVVDDEAGVECDLAPAVAADTSWVWAWPPSRSSRSKSVTSWRRPRTYAAVRPETPLPITPMSSRSPITWQTPRRRRRARPSRRRRARPCAVLPARAGASRTRRSR